MASDALRWSKFWWSDWLSDPALRSCSVGARGLWMDMLCLAFQGEPRGHVTIGGRPATPRQLAVLSGITIDECTNLLDELVQVQVFSTSPNGVIFSRRMVRDHAATEVAREAGKRGGNPLLRKSGTEGLGEPLRGGDKATLKLEAEAEAEAERKIPSATADVSPPPGEDAPALPLETPPGPRPPPVPLQQAVEIWNAVCGDLLGRVAKLHDTRQRNLRARLLEWPAEYRLDDWTAYCERILRSDFLSGRAPRSGEHANWRADFDWALKPANAVKVQEGRYDNDRSAPTGRRFADGSEIAPGTV